MNPKTSLVVFLAVFFLAFGTTLHLSVADDDDHGETSWLHRILDLDDDDDDHQDEHRKRKRQRHRDDEHHHSFIKPVSNSVYKEQCGACHFAYQPELLPAASWNKILANLEDHFGESIELENDSQKIIIDYLVANSAEHSSAKRAVKIMRSLGSQVPRRITDIPYIRE